VHLKTLADETRLRISCCSGEGALRLPTHGGPGLPSPIPQLALLERKDCWTRAVRASTFLPAEKNTPGRGMDALAGQARNFAGTARPGAFLMLPARQLLRHVLVRKFIEFKDKKQQKGADHGKTGQKSVH
jgi:hypothetical protein